MTKEELLKKIKPGESKSKIIQKMQTARLPLVIYGTGGYAKGLVQFCKQYQIKLDSACIDKEYYDPGQETWEGLPVYSLDDLPRDVNILIGFADFRKAERNLEKIKQCQEIFFLDTILFGINFIDNEFVEINAEKLLDGYNLLEDDYSRETFIAYLNAKVTGRPDELYDLVDFNQYFPTDIIKLTPREIFVDAGAYDGDTVLTFIKKVNNSYQYIYALEPDESNYTKLKKTITGIKNIKTFKSGAWSNADTLSFIDDKGFGTRSAISNSGEITIHVNAIDNLIEDHTATFIKMDIEGAELAALHGAEKTIKQSKPKLAICMYHRPEDLMTIPDYLRSIVPGYKLYLRPHLYLSQELVLYAIHE